MYWYRLQIKWNLKKKSEPIRWDPDAGDWRFHQHASIHLQDYTVS
jgi:hypothetical protein